MSEGLHVATFTVSVWLDDDGDQMVAWDVESDSATDMSSVVGWLELAKLQYLHHQGFYEPVDD